ncbi:MAG TPA: hypothetical protein VMZ22_06180 [Acidimicrobiales bacterium]|nr:hypothetical protein [Acidimicrobiales bacterium]
MLLVGTRKGLWLLEHDEARRNWTLPDPLFLGQIVNHAVADPRAPDTILAASSTGHLGPTVFRSRDRGKTWAEATTPPAFPEGDKHSRALTRVFWLTPGHGSENATWYAGGTPQGLFRSEDAGDTWAPVSGWNDHEMWAEWAEWPEQGTPDGSMLHSINVDPRDPSHLYIGLSGGGVFESTDAGDGWQPLNAGTAADFLPDPDAAYGHDPHCVRLHPQQPDRLYMQNHCGFYRLDRPATRWQRVGDNMPRATGDIGFPVELHARDPQVAWTFPMDGTEVWPRTSPDGRPVVLMTRDGGETWAQCTSGLPERGWYTVKRQAMTTDAQDPVGVYFGTTSGEVWASADEAASWTQVAAHLPEIYSVEYASGA